MAEYLIQDTTLDAIADAINAKTGGSSAMTPAEMVTAIGSISGGSLPTGMTHIGSGSFTFASRTVVTEKIYHGLDFTPKAVVIFSNADAFSVNDVIYSFIVNGLPNIAAENRKSERILAFSGGIGYDSSLYKGTYGQFVNSEYFYINHSSYYYKSGVTYNWFAFD